MRSEVRLAMKDVASYSEDLSSFQVQESPESRQERGSCIFGQRTVWKWLVFVTVADLQTPKREQASKYSNPEEGSGSPKTNTGR